MLYVGKKAGRGLSNICEVHKKNHKQLWWVLNTINKVTSTTELLIIVLLNLITKTQYVYQSTFIHSLLKHSIPFKNRVFINVNGILGDSFVSITLKP